MESPSSIPDPRLQGKRDPLGQILIGASFAGSVLCAFAVLVPWPALSTPASQATLLVLLTAAVIRGRNVTRHAEETRFWTDLAAGLGLTAAALVLHSLSTMSTRSGAVPGGRGYVELAIHVLLAAGAAAWMLASARQPDLRHRWRAPKLERALALPQVMLFVAGLFLYFILIPTPVWPPASPAPDPRFMLAASGFLGFRWALLWHSTPDPRFSKIYGALALSSGFVVIGTLLDILGPATPNPAVPRLGAMFGLLAGAFFAAAVDARGRWPDGARSSLWEKIQRAEGSLGPFEQTLLAALAFPTLHFLSYAAGFFPPERRSLHDILVLSWLVLLAALAMWQREIWQRRTRPLHEERQQAARSLRQIQKELLLSQERFAQSRKPKRSPPRLGEADFAAIFAACPEMIALNRISDGRYLEVNAACERLLGWGAEEMRGRTSKELGLWVRRRERLDLLRQLDEQGVVRDLEVTLRQRGGAEVLARLAAAEIELDGEPCLMTVLREGLPEERRARRLAEGSVSPAASPTKVAPRGVAPRGAPPRGAPPSGASA